MVALSLRSVRSCELIPQRFLDFIYVSDKVPFFVSLWKYVYYIKIRLFENLSEYVMLVSMVEIGYNVSCCNKRFNIVIYVNTFLMCVLKTYWFFSFSSLDK